MRGEADDAESHREGLISTADFLVYLRAFGTGCARAALVAVTVAAAVSTIAANVWLTKWTNGTAAGATNATNATNTNNATNATNASGAAVAAALVGGGDGRAGSAARREMLSLALYAALGGAAEVFSAVQVVLLTVCSLRASRLLQVSCKHACCAAWSTRRSPFTTRR